MSVSVLCFRVGTSAYGLAAGCVESITHARPERPYLGELLGDVTPGPPLEARTLRVSARGMFVEVVVDGPVQLVDVTPESVTPSPPTSPWVLGFARVADQLTILLDANTLVERTHNSRPLVTP